MNLRHPQASSRGIGLTEYLVILTFVALAAIAVTGLFGQRVKSTFTRSNQALVGVAEQASALQTASREQQDFGEGNGASEEVDGGDLQFSQTTASPRFSEEGSFSGQAISDVAAQLRAGTLTPAQVPVQIVRMDGNILIVNTRSSLALMQAGIPQSQWTIVDMTGNPEVMANIANRLERNGLTTSGTDTLRITGSGKNASTLTGTGTQPRP